MSAPAVPVPFRDALADRAGAGLTGAAAAPGVPSRRGGALPVREIAERSDWMYSIGQQPWIRGHRTHRRFVALLERLGLPGGTPRHAPERTRPTPIP